MKANIDLIALNTISIWFNYIYIYILLLLNTVEL